MTEDKHIVWTNIDLDPEDWYGHFNSADFPWEAENAIQDILTAEKKRNSGIF